MASSSVSCWDCACSGEGRTTRPGPCLFPSRGLFCEHPASHFRFPSPPELFTWLCWVLPALCWGEASRDSHPALWGFVTGARMFPSCRMKNGVKQWRGLNVGQFSMLSELNFVTKKLRGIINFVFTYYAVRLIPRNLLIKVLCSTVSQNRLTLF